MYDSQNDISRIMRTVHIMLFVTGLTPVLASFLSVWVQNASQNDKLTLMHYDRDEGDYVGQDFWGSSR